jgi:hypothetical protein
MIRSLLTILVLRAAGAIAQPGEPPVTPEVKAANEQIDALERRVRQGDESLPSLKTDYVLPGGSEGVPPQFTFFFEWRKGTPGASVLRICKVHVGREVYSVDSLSSFDEEGRPLKYLRLDSGVAGEPSAPPTRAGLSYDKQGRVVWTSSKGLTPALSPKKITELFQTLRTASKTFD